MNFWRTQFHWLHRFMLDLKQKTPLRFSISKKSIRSPDLSRTYVLYDKLTGLDQVRTAHEEVSQAEKRFIQCQVDRRQNQVEVFRLEETRNRLNSQLDGVSRSDENFLKLVTELHEVSRQHKQARTQLSAAEMNEQAAFEEFSGALRRSQAEERVQANRMRQWSIGLSVLAGLVGFGATWVRYHQFAQLSDPVKMVSASGEQNVTDIALDLRDVKNTLLVVKGNLETVSENLEKLCSADAGVSHSLPLPPLLSSASSILVLCGIAVLLFLNTR